jgi:hypothetical protein
MLNRFDVNGGQKRRFYNDLSVNIALAMGGVAGFFSAMLFAETLGTAGGIAVGVLSGVGVYSLVADWMERDRYYRP